MAGASPCYASPELLDENAPAIEDPILQQASDTFSFAVILAELVTRTGPWESASSLEAVTKNVIAGQRAYSRPLNLGTQDYHRTVANLIERCWDQAPRARPEMRIAYHQLLDVLRGMPKV